MKQINVRQYLSLSISEQIKYTSLLSCLNPKPLLSVKIEELSYNEVKQIFKELIKENTNVEYVFTTALRISKDDYLNLPIQNYFQIKKYLDGFFVSLKNNEVKLLQSVSADVGLWDIAGGSELDEFSDVLPLSQLAKLYGGYPFDYGEKSYIEIIYLLRMNNKQGQVESEFNKLKSKQK